MTNSLISADEIETYLECAEKWKYEHQLSVETADDAKSYERRAQLLRKIIFAVCEADPESESEAIEIATSELENRWETSTTESLYLAERQQTFDKAATRNALKKYLRGPGFEHIQNAVDWDETLLFGRLTDQMVTISLDLITETDEGLLVVQLLPNLDGVSYGTQGNNDARDHIDRSNYGGSFVGSILRAELAIRASKVVYNDRYDDLWVEYIVVGMAEFVSTSGAESPDGELVVEPEYRDLTDWHEDYGASNEELLSNIVEQIAQEETEIPEAFVEDIRNSTCGYCTYRKMCHSNLNWEVEF